MTIRYFSDLRQNCRFYTNTGHGQNDLFTDICLQTSFGKEGFTKQLSVFSYSAVEPSVLLFHSYSCYKNLVIWALRILRFSIKINEIVKIVTKKVIR